MSRQQTRGRRFAEAREQKGLTQKELAVRAGVAVSTIGAIEADRYQRSHPRVIDKLTAVLDIAPDASDVSVMGDGPYVSLIGRMPEDVQRTLALLGAWLSAMPTGRRNAEMQRLEILMFGGDADTE